MSTVGQIERRTQNRVVALFWERLGYDYLGHWQDQPRSSNIEERELTHWLRGRGVAEALIGKVLFELKKAAGNTARDLYDRNRDV